MNLHAMTTPGNYAPGTAVPGLPAYRPPGTVKQIGATSTYLGGPTYFPPVLPVGGAPSMSVARTNGGGAVTSIRRQSQWADFLDDRNISSLWQVAFKILHEAQGLSQGDLSYAELERRNHPYGRGAFTPSGLRRKGIGKLQGNRAGVSNMAVTNKHTGDFLRSWSVQVVRSKNGVEILLVNTAPYAQYLALGTTKMKAHGPFTTAPARVLSLLDNVWLQMTRDAYHRAKALEMVTGGIGF